MAQVGTPEAVYEEPADAYVADFLGVSNLMDADAPSPDGRGRAGCGWGSSITRRAGVVGSSVPVKLAIRPERVRLEHFESTGPNRVPAMVERVVFLGSSTQVIVRLAPGMQVQALVQNQG